MDGEQNGTQEQQGAQQEQQAAHQQAEAQQETQGKHAKPQGEGAAENTTGAIDTGRFEAQLAERDTRIAELEAQIAEAARCAESADGLREEIAALKQQGADERVEFSLLLAGCRNVKAARAVLEDHGGDVDAPVIVPSLATASTASSCASSMSAPFPCTACMPPCHDGILHGAGVVG